MLKHGRAGVPMEVMGLMLGEFVDDYTVRQLMCGLRVRNGQANCADLVCGRLCDAAERYDRYGRIGRSRLPDENAGHAEADGTVSISLPDDGWS